jgi:hypothetical protein
LTIKVGSTERRVCAVTLTKRGLQGYMTHGFSMNDDACVVAGTALPDDASCFWPKFRAITLRVIASRKVPTGG